MKTPRDILLSQQRTIEPRLDAARQSAVEAVCDRRTVVNNAPERRSVTAATTIFQIFWRELILPSRRIWTGLAALWVGMLIVNFSLRDASQTPSMKSASSPEMIMSLQQQERLLAELAGPNEPAVAEPG